MKRYGSWTEAVAEARRHGVKLRQAEGYRDGNPAEQYEAIVNDTRAVGGVKESAAALFRSAAQEAGVAGAAVMESTEWLDVLMNVHDTIKPKMMSRFADAAEYEDAKVELAGRMIGDIMSHPEMTDAEAVFEGILKHNREVAAMAAGSEERAAEVTKGLKSVQQAQRKAFADRMRENKRGQAVQEYAEATGETDETVLKTVGDMNERLTFLREEYERRLKAESQRLKLERQRMLDDITLKFAEKERRLNIENDFLAHEYAKEQMRADYAERQLVFQQDEIADWAAENQRKAAEWEQLQKERDEKAETLWKEYAEKAENVLTNRAVKNAKAEALAKEREKKAREGRKADELKRSIRNNAAQLNQMALRPKPGKYVQKSLIVQAAEVAKLADMAVLNNNAVAKLTALQDSIRRSGEMDAGIHTDWENSGVEKADPDTAGRHERQQAGKARPAAAAAGRSQGPAGRRQGRTAAGPAAPAHPGDGEPHLSAHDGRPAADAEGHYGQHPAHHPDREQDPDPCEGRRSGQHGHEGRPRGAELGGQRLRREI